MHPGLPVIQDNVKLLTFLAELGSFRCRFWARAMLAHSIAILRGILGLGILLGVLILSIAVIHVLCSTDVVSDLDHCRII
jgi:hypothetical protein